MARFQFLSPQRKCPQEKKVQHFNDTFWHVLDSQNAFCAGNTSFHLWVRQMCVSFLLNKVLWGISKCKINEHLSHLCLIRNNTVMLFYALNLCLQLHITLPVDTTLFGHLEYVRLDSTLNAICYADDSCSSDIFLQEWIRIFRIVLFHHTAYAVLFLKFHRHFVALKLYQCTNTSFINKHLL